MTKGWIKLHRQMLNWEWFGRVNTQAVFIYLLLSANVKDKDWHGLIIKRGQVVTTQAKISKILHLKRQPTRNALLNLQATNEITIQTNKHYTIFTVVKYDEFQQVNHPKNHKVNHQPTIQPTILLKNKEIKPPIVPRKGQKLIDLFNQLYGKSYTLTPGREKKYQLRRKRFEDSDLELALRNMSNKPFYKGDNKSGWLPDPDFFLRSDEQIDNFLNIKKQERLIKL